MRQGRIRLRLKRSARQGCRRHLHSSHRNAASVQSNIKRPHTRLIFCPLYFCIFTLCTFLLPCLLSRLVAGVNISETYTVVIAVNDLHQTQRSFVYSGDPQFNDLYRLSTAPFHQLIRRLPDIVSIAVPPTAPLHTTLYPLDPAQCPHASFCTSHRKPAEAAHILPSGQQLTQERFVPLTTTCCIRASFCRSRLSVVTMSIPVWFREGCLGFKSTTRSKRVASRMCICVCTGMPGAGKVC